MASDADRRRKTWLDLDDQEWAVVMFMRLYRQQFVRPPVFYDLTLKVQDRIVTGKLDPNQRLELHVDKDTVVIDGVARRIERRAVLVDGETRTVQASPA